jgi:hypothetical protein
MEARMENLSTSKGAMNSSHVLMDVQSLEHRGCLTEWAWTPEGRGRSSRRARDVGAIDWDMCPVSWCRLGVWHTGSIKASPLPRHHLATSLPPDSPAPPYFNSHGGRQGLLSTTCHWPKHQLYPRHFGECVHSCSAPTNSSSHVSQKLVVIGGTVETARRASLSAWNGFIDCSSLPFKVT